MPETGSPALFCSRCGRAVVVANAAFCKECGSRLAFAVDSFSRRGEWAARNNPWIAAALSALPGAGHFYRRRYLASVLWFFAVLIAYGAQPFGLLLHLICAANAALQGAWEPPTQPAPERRESNSPRSATGGIAAPR